MEYEERDIVAQGEYYTRHVSAMTGEGLHAKSDIAAELAHRDMEIDRLKGELSRGSAGSIPNQEHAALITTLFVAFLQTKGIWPCVLEIGEPPKKVPQHEVFNLRDEFVSRN